MLRLKLDFGCSNYQNQPFLHLAAVLPEPLHSVLSRRTGASMVSSPGGCSTTVSDAQSSTSAAPGRKRNHVWSTWHQNVSCTRCVVANNVYNLYSVNNCPILQSIQCEKCIRSAGGHRRAPPAPRPAESGTTSGPPGWAACPGRCGATHWLWHEKYPQSSRPRHAHTM